MPCVRISMRSRESDCLISRSLVFLAWMRSLNICIICDSLFLSFVFKGLVPTSPPPVREEGRVDTVELGRTELALEDF